MKATEPTTFSGNEILVLQLAKNLAKHKSAGMVCSQKNNLFCCQDITCKSISAKTATILKNTTDSLEKIGAVLPYNFEDTSSINRYTLSNENYKMLMNNKSAVSQWEDLSSAEIRTLIDATSAK